MFFRIERNNNTDDESVPLVDEPAVYLPMDEVLWDVVEHNGVPKPEIDKVDFELIARQPFDPLKTGSLHNVTRTYSFNATIRENVKTHHAAFFKMSFVVRFDETASNGDPDLFLPSIEKLSVVLPAYLGDNHRRWLINAFEQDCIELVIERELLNLSHKMLVYPDIHALRDSVLTTSGKFESQVKMYVSAYLKSCGVPSSVQSTVGKFIRLEHAQVVNSNNVQFNVCRESLASGLYAAGYDGLIKRVGIEKIIKKATECTLSLIFDVAEYTVETAKLSGREAAQYNSDVAFDYYLFDVSQMMISQVCTNPMECSFADLMLKKRHAIRYSFSK